MQQTQSSEVQSESQLIYSFPKNPRESVHLSLREFKGRQYIDLRIWFCNEENPDQLYPSKKGLGFSVEHIGELLKGVNHLAHALERGERKYQEPPVNKAFTGMKRPSKIPSVTSQKLSS